MNEKYNLFIYGYNSDSHSLGAGELFVATVVCTSKADQLRKLKNYRRQIKRNETRKRALKQTLTKVEVDHNDRKGK